MQEYERPLSVSQYLDDQLQLANHQIAAWSKVRTFILTMIDTVLKEERDPPPPLAPNSKRKPKPVFREVSFDVSLHGLEVDLSGAMNNLDRTFLIAQEAYKHGKTISITEIAQYLIDHEHTATSLDNAKNIVSQAVSEFGRYFQRIRPGLYNFCPDSESVSVTDDPSGDELSVIQ